MYMYAIVFDAFISALICSMLHRKAGADWA